MYSRKYLAEFVYGATDGTVTTFAIVAGVAGAALSPSIILILGFANVFADGFSMAASDFLSQESDQAVNKRRMFRKTPIQTALATFVAFAFVGSIPLMPFMIAFGGTSSIDPMRVSVIVTGITFLVIGAIRGLVAGKHWLRSAIETFIIGAGASGIAYLVGSFLRGIVG